MANSIVIDSLSMMTNAESPSEMLPEEAMERIKRVFDSIKVVPRTKDEFVLTASRTAGKSRMMQQVMNSYGVLEDRPWSFNRSDEPETPEARMERVRAAQMEWAAGKAIRDAEKERLKQEHSERKRIKKGRKGRKVNHSKNLPQWGEF